MPGHRPSVAAIFTSNPNRWIMVLGVLLVFIASGIAQIDSSNGASPLQPHVPILIDGNSNFLGSNGVTSGSGTSQDPYVIEGWSIAAGQSQAAVEIKSTSAFFIVRNIETFSGFAGVYLLNANDGSVVNSTLNGNEAIRIEGSQDVNVSRNRIVNGQLLVLDTNQGPLSTNLVVADNTLVDSTIWIGSCTTCLDSPTMMRVSGNTILGHSNSSDAIFLSAVGATIADNFVSGTGTGISVGGSQITVSNNTVQTALDSIVIGANATRLSGNIMTGLGVRIQGSTPPYDYPSYYDSHVITPNNLVNGNPVLYYNHCAGVNVNNVIVGQLIIASCSQVQIANLTISNAGSGIFMAYVKQAKLLDSHLKSNSFGLWVTESSDVNVSATQFVNNEGAIRIDHSANFTMSRSSVTENLQGLEMYNSSDARVADNIVVSNKGAGVIADSVSNLILSGNRVMNNTIGLELLSFTNALVQGNWVSGNRDDGMAILSGNGLNITGNSILYDRAGVSFGINGDTGSLVYNTIVYRNNFVYNLVDQADHLLGMVVTWDNGYPSGGNYWSDYAGVDQCSGADQNICTSPDGIGDTPYTGIIQITPYGQTRVQSPLTDHYPLMKPYGNITQDTAAPYWPQGSTLALTKVNSTSVSLYWSKSTDDTWVSEYEITENGRLVATVPGNVFSYTLSGLTPGTTLVFKIEAADSASNLSSDGPSAAVTLPDLSENPSTSQFSLAWWEQNLIWIVVAGATTAAFVGGTILVRRRIARSREKA